jgi:uncharacterized protein YjiS (DUF1127 family)
VTTVVPKTLRKIMSIDIAQPSALPRSTSGFPSRRRSRFRRLAASVAGLWRRMANRNRLRHDWLHLEEMTDHELKDIGLRRVGPRQFLHISDVEGG